MRVLPTARAAVLRIPAIPIDMSDKKCTVMPLGGPCTDRGGDVEVRKSISLLAVVMALVAVMAVAGCSSGAASSSAASDSSASASASASAEASASSASAEAASSEASASAEASASSASAETTSGSAAAAEALAPGQYEATFKTDSSMFHVNEANKDKGVLTVADDGTMTIHVSLASKKILNLYSGLAADAENDADNLIQPTTDTVKYEDGVEEEVYGFDIPVPAIGEEFDVALIGEKGKWYDHKVSVTDPVAL